MNGPGLAGGDCVVAHSLEETLVRLSTVLRRSPVSRLIVAGDLLESARPCPDTARDLARLKCWLTDRRVDLLILEGNHDLTASLFARRPSVASKRLPATCLVAGWTIGHGHQPIPGPARMSGHHHPVFRCAGIAAPCFLVGHGTNHVAGVFEERCGLQRRYRRPATAMARRFSALPGEYRRRRA